MKTFSSARKEDLETEMAEIPLVTEGSVIDKSED